MDTAQLRSESRERLDHCSNEAYALTSSLSHSLSRTFDSKNIPQKLNNDTKGVRSIRNRCVRKLASWTLPFCRL